MTYKELCTQPLLPISYEDLIPMIKDGARTILNHQRDGWNILYMYIADDFDALTDEDNRSYEFERNDDDEFVDEDGNVVEDSPYYIKVYLKLIVCRNNRTSDVGVYVDANELLAIAKPLVPENKLHRIFMRRGDV